MKKLVSGFFAVAVALVAFAFTTSNTIVADCSANAHYYFQVSTATNTTTLATAKANLILVTDADSQADPDEVEFKTFSQAPFGCDVDNDFICALGYEIGDIQLNSSTNQWEPKRDAFNNYLDPSCIVERQEQ